MKVEGKRMKVGQPVFLLLIFSFALSASPLKLREGDVVAFAGGTDMVRMQSEGRLEAALTHHSLEASPKFRDLAWDGDTVYFQSTVGERWREEAFGNWNSQLKRVGATVVIAQFGKIESLEGGERLPAFIEAYGKLIDSFSSHGRKVLLLGPSPFEWEGMPVGSLKEYTLAIEQLAAQRGLQFVAPDQEEPVGSFIRALSGSSYVVDWYNPITCHQDDFYRHPGRDMTQGRMLFESSRTGCMACHQVGEQGGQIGPDLTAVGSGTPFDGIVTEVLWPGRQVKAGFALTRVTMKDKRVFQGYIQPSRKKANLLLRDFSTGQIQAIPQQDIASTETLGSLMPSTSQSLSRSELIDLLSYLFRLSG